MSTSRGTEPLCVRSVRAGCKHRAEAWAWRESSPRDMKIRHAAMDSLEFFTQEELVDLLHSRKTELSCLTKPRRLLNQLRDADVISEDQHTKVLRAKGLEGREQALYQLLHWLEAEIPHKIKVFWGCIFQEHIMQHYPPLRLLKNSILDGTYTRQKKLEKDEEMEEGKEKKEGKKQGQKEGRKNNKITHEKQGQSEESEEKDKPGPSTQPTPRKKKRPPKPIYGTPLNKKGKGSPEAIWNWPLYKSQLPVTCGDKQGTLYRDKLAKGERCVLAEGRWFSPRQFEEFGGKSSSKNWKLSIRCNKETLHRLIQEGHLQSPLKKRGRRYKGRRRLFSSDDLSSSSSASNMTHPLTTDGEEGDQEEERGDEEMLSEVQADHLPVTCGSATGSLQRDRFASGLIGRCIRTEDRWLSPCDFANENSCGEDGSNWKACIHCEGQPLSALIERRVLVPHSVLCQCRLCSSTESDRWDNDDDCYACGSRGSLVCCDRCPHSFHTSCHLPRLEDLEDNNEPWLCTYCVLKDHQQSSPPGPLALSEALDSRLEHYLLQCQYLLLCLYKADQSKVFIQDPCQTVQGYAQHVESPMWLDKVSEKLLDGQYSTVSAFVRDIELIFHNCAQFNQDNQYGQMGVGLSDLFRAEFKKVFGVGH
ncbi:autoimmune regulator isoform X2 [Amia ocellicauda]|uniref:autoimmune regulator isoform X2 n=1 Tax=Amia ocellicauda TaxID=2972642 RepID=UPI0034645DEA